MKTIFKIAKGINYLALSLLLFGAYGLAITGFLQVLAALLFLIVFPKNKLIYCYFGLVAVFFAIWDGSHFGGTFAIPFFLIGFLTYTIHKQKIKS